MVTGKELQLHFSSEAAEQIEVLQKKSGSVSVSDTIRNALRLYEWLLQQQDDGYKLQLAKNGHTYDVDLLLVRN